MESQHVYFSLIKLSGNSLLFTTVNLLIQYTS